MPEQPRRGTLLNRLSLRLALALGLGAGAVLLVAGSFNIATQRESLLELSQAHAERTALMVRRSTRDAMLANKSSEVQGILESLGGQGDIESIRIFDKDGRIYSSSQRSEVGTLIAEAPRCAACHGELTRGGSAAERNCLRIVSADRDDRFMGVLEPIPNEPACSTASCHAHEPDRQVLGVLDVHLDMAHIEGHVSQSTRQLGVGLVATIVLVLLLAGFLTWYLVLRPVRVFTEATLRVRRGELATQVPIDSTHEIGQMGRSWNAMIAELERARTELEDWSRTLEDRVREKTAQLEAAHEKMIVVEKMASLGKLAAVMAHEINNPLAGIGTYAKLLQRRLEKPGDMTDDARAEALEALRLVESESARCGRIVQNLLLFSRTPGARFSEQDLEPIIARCVMLVQHRADLQEVAIHVAVAPGTPHIECDASQIQQVLLALCMNALESMPDGGELSIEVRADGDFVALEVIDTGCGIPAEDLPHVFEPFYTSKEEGAGVGLGLAVVYGVVHRHRGSVTVESEPGRGTRFAVRLPLDQPDREPTPDAAPEPAGRNTP